MKSFLVAATTLLTIVIFSTSCSPLAEPVSASLCDPALPDDGKTRLSFSAFMASDNIEYANVYDPACPSLIFSLDRGNLTPEDERRLSDYLYSAPIRHAVSAFSEVTLAFTGTVRRDGENRYLFLDSVSNIKHRRQPVPSVKAPETLEPPRG